MTREEEAAGTDHHQYPHCIIWDLVNNLRKIRAEGYIVGKLSPALSLGVAILCVKGTSYKKLKLLVVSSNCVRIPESQSENRGWSPLTTTNV